jgi:hypothetical protein
LKVGAADPRNSRKQPRQRQVGRRSRKSSKVEEAAERKRNLKVGAANHQKNRKQHRQRELESRSSRSSKQ